MKHFESDLEHLERIRHIADIAFSAVMAVGMFFVIVVCPIMMKLEGF